MDHRKAQPDPLLRITPDDFVPSTPSHRSPSARIDPLLRITPPVPDLAADDPAPQLLLSVIVPIRNEQDVLPACLESLISQSEPAFALESEWELLLVDDASTDDSPRLLAQAAAERPGVRVLTPGDPIVLGLTGKSNACWTGAQAARGSLLLFTDADTVYTPGSLSRARHELEKYQVTLLSYSPRQLTTGFLQRILMPLVFAELAIAYPPARVSDPADRTAAANGQFLLVESEPYFDAGGHRALGRQVLEDVALARNLKRAHNTIRFRYAPDALSTRMYRSTAGMIEGWTKNLALLFTAPIPMALMRLLDVLLLIGIPIIAFAPAFYWTTLQFTLFVLVWGRVLYRFYARTAKSNFPAADIALSIFGLPFFIYLLVRSYIAIRITKRVTWSNRTYPT